MKKTTKKINWSDVREKLFYGGCGLIIAATFGDMGFELGKAIGLREGLSLDFIDTKDVPKVFDSSIPPITKASTTREYIRKADSFIGTIVDTILDNHNKGNEITWKHTNPDEYVNVSEDIFDVIEQLGMKIYDPKTKERITNLAAYDELVERMKAAEKVVESAVDAVKEAV